MAAGRERFRLPGAVPFKETGCLREGELRREAAAPCSVRRSVAARFGARLSIPDVALLLGCSVAETLRRSVCPENRSRWPLETSLATLGRDGDHGGELAEDMSVRVSLEHLP